MPTKLVDDSGRIYLSLAYDNQHDWVACTWLGEQNASTIPQGSEANLSMLQRYGCCCLLNDNRRITGTWSDEVVEALMTDWAPRAIRTGLTHMATIVHPESLAAIYEEVMQLDLAQRLHMRAFYALYPAQQWLLSRSAQ